MARIKYTPGGERRRFRQRGEGLRAGEQRIQEQAQIGIDAMKLAALRQEKLDNQFISGLRDKGAFEEGVLREKQELESKARTRKYEAFTKFADTDVTRMEGEAADLKKKAEFWKDFAPKFAQNLSKLAEGTWYFQDKLKGMALYEEMNKNGLLKNITDSTGDASYGLETNMNLDRNKLQKEGNFPLSAQLGKVINGNSHWLSLRIADWAKENKELIRDDIIASYGHQNYTAENAVEVQTFGMYQFMEKAGISPRSAGGRMLLDQATNVGLIDRRNINAVNAAENTTGNIETSDKDITVALKAWIATPNETTLDTLRQKILTQTNNYLDGTFLNKEGSIDSPLGGPRNKGQQYNVVLDNIIKTNYKWMTRDQVEDLLALEVPSFDGTKTEAFNKKFPTSAEKLLEEYDKLKREQDRNADDGQKQKSINRMNVILTDYNKKYEKNPPSKYDKFELVNQVMNDPLLLDNQKKEILSKWSVNYEDLDDVSYIALIHNNIKDGEFDEVERLLNSKDLKPGQRNRILKQVSYLKELQEMGPLFAGSTQSGILSFFELGNQKFNSLQDVYPGTNIGQGLSPSGVIAKSDYKAFAVETYLLARQTMSVEEAIIHTKKVLDDEWKLGAEKNEGRFARELVSGDSSAWQFNRHMDIDDKAYINFTNKLNDSDFKGDGNWLTLSDIDLLEFLNKDPSSILTDSYEDVNQIITHDRLTNKAEMKVFARQLENARIHSSTKDGVSTFDIAVPQGFLVVAKHLNKPVSEVVNAWIKSKEGDKKWDFLQDVRMPVEDEKSLLQIINNDKTTPRNLVAAKYVNDIKEVKGKIPKRHEIWQYFNQLEEGADRNEALLKLFQEETTITWELIDGKYYFSDTNGFLANGGLDLPLNAKPEALLEALGFNPKQIVGKYETWLKNQEKHSNDTSYTNMRDTYRQLNVGYN